MARNILTFVTLLSMIIIIASRPALSADYTVSGRVTDPDGQGVYPVDIDVADSGTGDPIPIFGDSTTIHGYYSIILADGIYDIAFIPDKETGLAPVEIDDVVVENNVTLNVTVQWGFEISGTVTDSEGNSVVGLDIDARDSETNQVLITPGDNTDENGYYSVFVPEGILDFIYTPLSNDTLPTHTLWDIEVHDDIVINVQLSEPAILSGWVRNEGGTGVANVDLDVDDAITGKRIKTLHDNSNDEGYYWIIVPVGILDIMYGPQEGSEYADHMIHSLAANHDLDLNVTLKEGFEISGYVTNSMGEPVQGVDLDVDDTFTEERLYTSSDNTDSDGYYSIMVPLGMYNIYFEPPEGASLPGHELDSVIVIDNTVINQSLETGYSISGIISDDGGSPVYNCDLDVINSRTDDLLYTPKDNSDEDGHYLVIVPPDTFDIIFKPKQESGTVRDTLHNVVVNDDLILDMTLQRNYNQAIVLVPEDVSIFPGDQLFEKITIYNNDIQQKRVQVSIAAYLPNGKVFRILNPFPQNGVKVPANGHRSGTLPILVPPAVPPILKPTLKGYILDFFSGDTLNYDKTKVNILDPNNPLLQKILYEE